MTVKSIDLVREFHARFGQPDADAPMLDNEQVNELRVRLIAEELDELCEALGLPFAIQIVESLPLKRDPVAVLDALTDLQYVLDGAYLQLGFASYKDAATAEVHRSNMSKLGEDGRPVLREDGKITKGPRYEPPDLGKVMRRAPRKSLLDWGPDGLFDDTRAVHLHDLCHASTDGECLWRECPQRKEYRTHCPLDADGDDE